MFVILPPSLSRLFSAALLALVLALAPTPQPAGAKGHFTLETIQKNIEKKYSGVAHMSTAALAKNMSEKKDMIVFDVREKDEFAVSRIPGAVRVDPNIWQSSFMKKFGDKIAGKTVIFYCSVGVRSTKLARYVQAAMRKKGARAIYNLKGGIFAWHNENKSLANARGQTSFVHPYNKYWGQLVDKQSLTRYK